MWPDFFNIWPFARAKCCHNSNKVGKIRFKSLNCPRLLKFCQRGGILPNLVTLALICHLATIIVYHRQLEFSGVLLVQFNLFQHVVLPLEHERTTAVSSTGVLPPVLIPATIVNFIEQKKFKNTYSTYFYTFCLR